MAGSLDIAVTGLGALAPGGVGVPALWEAALQGRRAQRPVTRFDASGLRCRDCCPLPEGALERVSESVRFRYDLHAQHAWLAAKEAFASAGLSGLDEDRIGVTTGTAHGPIAWLDEQLDGLATPWADHISAYASPRLSLNTATSVVALGLGLRGPQTGVVTACAAGLSAIQVACDHLRAGRADVMLAGGAEASITRLAYAAYERIGAMASGPYRPFDRDRDGFVMGEGAAYLVLERAEHARGRGATIHATVLGDGASSDGEHQTRMSESGRGYRSAMRQALAGSSRPVDLVNAHGSGTLVNDRAEGLAIADVFGVEAPMVQSTKALTGHMMGAAGAIEAVLSVLQLRESVELATVGCEVVDASCGVPIRLGQPRERRLRRVLCNSAGFGGGIASVLFGAVE